MSFTEGVKITGFDDFITPSQLCIVPIKPEALKRTQAKIRLTNRDNFEISEEKVTITLNDCLACSGCITTAESILINEQSSTEFIKKINELKAIYPDNLVVVSISPQSIASLSVRFNLGNSQNAYIKLRQLFRSLSVDVVLNTNIGRELSLQEVSHDVLERISIARANGGKGLPVLASACPGWVCYAEKHKHNHMLVPLISKVRSPQQMMGLIVKKLLPRKDARYEDTKIFHVSVMPCFDKKLEASRKEFSLNGEREVDMVLSTKEIESIVVERGYDFGVSTATADDEHFLETWLSAAEGAGCAGDARGAGGYLEAAMRHCSNQMFNLRLENDLSNDPRVQVRPSRDQNQRELAVINENDGTEMLRFAHAYGFRSLQGLIQRLRKGVCGLDFIEIMACPGGCLNGGGQIRSEEVGNKKPLLNMVQSVYGASHGTMAASAAITELLALIQDPAEMHTTYNIVEKLDIVNPASFVF